jgi:sortase A
MTPERRQVPRYAVVARLAAAALGLIGWSLTAGESAGTGTGAVRVVEHPVPTAAARAPAAKASPPTTAPPGAPAVAVLPLPVPEDAPADAHADTPVVVHGTLALPSIGVSQPLHEGVTLTAINRGPSHWPGTALPGQLGNVVVAGHRTTYTMPFYDIDRLVPGDPLVFSMNDGTVWTYELTATEIVDPDAMHIVEQTPEHTATLFACHPRGSAAWRFVAHFRLRGS